jgi:tRNA modification GTPase
VVAAADTIAAVATAPGAGAIGVVRVSGPDLRSLLVGILGAAPEPRRASVLSFIDGRGEPIDEGIALYFPRPGSYTGEDVLELQGHGGPAVLGLVLRRCLELGARLAEPGEFTRRAFLNGKMDLAQAESVADLIAASTASAARAATRSLRGVFSAEIQALVAELIELRALTEASLDFPDEDIDFVRAADAAGRVRAIGERLERVLGQSIQGPRLRDGLSIVLVGPPNVGKSRLLNQLASDDVAIVTPLPGSTRDPVRASLELNGIPLHVIDTAGVRDTTDPVERIGIERTWRAVREADLVLVLREAGLESTAEDAWEADLPPDLPSIVVENKVDLLGLPAHVQTVDGRTRVRMSALTGEGMDLLRRAMLDAVGLAPATETLFLARERHLRALDAARRQVRDAESALQAAAPALELFAESLRLAQRELASITGEFSSDDLLGEIFARFCIGK